MARQILKITESQLKKVIDAVINEQVGTVTLPDGSVVSAEEAQKKRIEFIAALLASVDKNGIIQHKAHNGKSWSKIVRILGITDEELAQATQLNKGNKGTPTKNLITDDDLLGKTKWFSQIKQSVNWSYSTYLRSPVDAAAHFLNSFFKTRDYNSIQRMVIILNAIVKALDGYCWLNPRTGEMVPAVKRFLGLYKQEEGESFYFQLKDFDVSTQSKEIQNIKNDIIKNIDRMSVMSCYTPKQEEKPKQEEQPKQDDTKKTNNIKKPLPQAKTLEDVEAKTGYVYYGMKGEVVSQIQDYINRASGRIDVISVTGVFDKPTLDSIKRIQANMGVSPDGIVGPATLEKLKQAVRFNARLEPSVETPKPDLTLKTNPATDALKGKVPGIKVAPNTTQTTKPAPPPTRQEYRQMRRDYRRANRGK